MAWLFLNLMRAFVTLLKYYKQLSSYSCNYPLLYFVRFPCISKIKCQIILPKGYIGVYKQNMEVSQMTKISSEQAQDELKKGMRNVTEEDVQKVLDKQEEIEKKFKSGGPLGKFITEIKLLFTLIKDYVSGEYREIPWWTISAVVAALIYVLSPIDLIPDFIPIIGYIDDAAVVAACLKLIQNDLQKYQTWKNS